MCGNEQAFSAAYNKKIKKHSNLCTVITAFQKQQGKSLSEWGKDAYLNNHIHFSSTFVQVSRWIILQKSVLSV